jgi:hypothetical protein
MLNDAHGRETKVGDEIAYAVRDGSTVRLVHAAVTEIVPRSPDWRGNERFSLRVRRIAEKRNYETKGDALTPEQQKVVFLPNPLFVRLGA